MGYPISLEYHSAQTPVEGITVTADNADATFRVDRHRDAPDHAYINFTQDDSEFQLWLGSQGDIDALIEDLSEIKEKMDKDA